MNLNEDINIYFKNKRDQYMVDIRKRKNDHFIQEKRRKLAEDSSSQSNPSSYPKTHLERLQQFNELAASFFEAVKQADYEQLTSVLELIRKAISIDENPPLNYLINTGVVPHIIKLMDNQFFQYERLMVECAWTLANVTSGTSEHVNYVVELDLIPRAICLLEHPLEDVKDNTIWTLANIAGDSLGNRDRLIELEIVPKLVSILDDNTFSMSFISHVSWFISNLVRGKPYPKFSEVEPLTKVAQFFIKYIEHDEVVINSMWALSFFSDGDDKQIKAVLDLDLSETVLHLMTSDNPKMVAPALRTAGNLVSGRDELTEIMIEAGILPVLSYLLEDKTKLFRKEACWGLSNIMAGAAHQIEEVFAFNNREIIKKLIDLVYNDDGDVAREAMFCLANACSEGTLQHIQILVDHDIIDLLVQSFKGSNEPVLLKVCLEALESILSSSKQMYTGGPDKNPYIIKLAQCEGFAAIEALQSHPDNDVYTVVSRLIENHLEYE